MTRVFYNIIIIITRCSEIRYRVLYVDKIYNFFFPTNTNVFVNEMKTLLERLEIRNVRTISVIIYDGEY